MKSLSRMCRGISAEFEKIPVDEFRKNFQDTGRPTRRKPILRPPTPLDGAPGRASRGAPSKTPALDQYTIDLHPCAQKR